MSPCRATLFVATAVLLVAAAVPAAHAQGRPPSERVQQPPRPSAADMRAPPRRELSDSVRRVERVSRGRVLSAEAMQFDGRVVHRIKVLDDSGRVRVYVDDPIQPTPRPTRDDDD